jgi:DNA-binding protein YbaB
VDPQNSRTDEGQPGAALLRQADRLASALDDYRHHMNNSPYPGTDEAQTVRATVTANFRITELIIEDGLLSLGTEVVVRRVTEALLNAQAAAKRGRQDRAETLSGPRNNCTPTATRCCAGSSPPSGCCRGPWRTPLSGLRSPWRR